MALRSTSLSHLSVLQYKLSDAQVVHSPHSLQLGGVEWIWNLRGL